MTFLQWGKAEIYGLFVLLLAGAVFRGDGEEVQEFVGIESDGTGELNQEEYDQAIRDLVNFLEYSGEPMKLERQRLGWWVMGFIAIFFILAILLKKEYWRDVH